MKDEIAAPESQDVVVAITIPALDPESVAAVAAKQSQSPVVPSASMSDLQKQQAIFKNRVVCFCVTYFAYACIHATRTAWSSSKQSLNEELNEDDSQFLGIVDTCFLLAYAISMKLIGSFSRRFSINYLLGYGMISASVCLLSIYFICQIRINRSFILLMMIANGISQSTGWPSVVASMGNWFGTGQKGVLMGLWATSGNFGNMIGYFIQDFIVNTLNLNWSFVLFLIGMVLLIIGSLIVFNFDAYPIKLGISFEDLSEYDKRLALKSNKHTELRDEQVEQQDGQSKNSSNNYNNHQIDDESLEIRSFKRNNTLRLEKVTFANQEKYDDQEENLDDDEIAIDDEMNASKETTSPEPIASQSTNHSHSQSNDNFGQLQQGSSASISSPIQTSQAQQQQEEEEPITYFNAWRRVPGLTVIALTMGGVKGTVYGLMFWMPIYLQEHGLKQQAAWICSMNEIGTFAGGLLLGYLIDKFTAFRATIIASLLALSSVIMLTIHLLPSGVSLPYFFSVLSAGVCLGGPYTLLGGAIAIDLAQQPGVRGHKNITALLAGMIEGFGSFVAAIVQILIPMFGQENIFVLFTFSSLLSCCCLLQKAKIEVKGALGIE